MQGHQYSNPNQEQGFLGLFTGMFTKGGAAVVGAIVIASIFTIFFSPKD